MQGHVVREGKRVKFGLIAEHRETWPIARLCKVLGVSRQGFHSYLQEPTSKRERAAEALDTVVLQVFNEHHGRYGSPHVAETLKQE
jgi:putative transposase